MQPTRKRPRHLGQEGLATSQKVDAGCAELAERESDPVIVISDEEDEENRSIVEDLKHTPLPMTKHEDHHLTQKIMPGWKILESNKAKQRKNSVRRLSQQNQKTVTLRLKTHSKTNGTQTDATQTDATEDLQPTHNDRPREDHLQDSRTPPSTSHASQHHHQQAEDEVVKAAQESVEAVSTSATEDELLAMQKKLTELEAEVVTYRQELARSRAVIQHSVQKDRQNMAEAMCREAAKDEQIATLLQTNSVMQEQLEKAGLRAQLQTETEQSRLQVLVHRPEGSCEAPPDSSTLARMNLIAPVSSSLAPADPRLAVGISTARQGSSGSIFGDVYVSFKGKPGKETLQQYQGCLAYDDAFCVKNNLLALCDGVGEGGPFSGMLARELAWDMARNVDMEDLLEKLENVLRRLGTGTTAIMEPQIIKQYRPSSTVVALELSPLEPGEDDEIQVKALELGDTQFAVLRIDYSGRRARCSYLSLARYHCMPDGDLSRPQPPFQAALEESHMRNYRCPGMREQILSTQSARSGDIIVAGSDGFWDNLGSNDQVRRQALEQMATGALLSSSNPDHAGLELVHRLGNCLRRLSTGKMDSPEGKKDDLTLIVTRVFRGRRDGLEISSEDYVTPLTVRKGSDLIRTTSGPRRRR